MAKSLRLLLFSECNRRCPGCCNKDWNLNALPVCMSFRDYDQIILTGGEPMLRPELVKKVASDIRQVTDAPILLYTAKTSKPQELIDVLQYVDGITLTLHTRGDLSGFYRFDSMLYNTHMAPKSLRLNVFKGIEVKAPVYWQVKRDIEWIKNCPLPSNEVFMRYDVPNGQENL